MLLGSSQSWIRKQTKMNIALKCIYLISGRFSKSEPLDFVNSSDNLIIVGSMNITIVPILVGAISASKEQLYGRLLAPYLLRQDIIFVISSDFCHW
jgi:Memo-like protein